MSIKVSVIIPVYNAEKYITYCIESLINQTLQNCEFIFINDGSSDKSRMILDTYKKYHKNIILVDQENQGVSIARNKGLKIAKGEYIGFVDADDYVKRNTFEVLYNSAKADNCDVIFSDYERENEGIKELNRYYFPKNVVLTEEFLKQELLPRFIDSDSMNAVWNKLYRNDLIKSLNLTFPDKVTLGEDLIFNINFFSQANTVKYVNYSGYYYREVNGSATRNIVTNDYFKAALINFLSDLPEVYKKKIDRELIEEMKSIKLLQNVLSYTHIYLTSSKEISFVKRYNYVKNMVTNSYVKTALRNYHHIFNRTANRFDRFLLKMIKQKWIMAIYLATSYSKFRNKNRGV
jgi:glycosyltransferase involved in cell wall biosynthesis